MATTAVMRALPQSTLSTQLRPLFLGATETRRAPPLRTVRDAARPGRRFLSPASDENLNMRPPLVMLAG